MVANQALLEQAAQAMRPEPVAIQVMVLWQVMADLAD
jgi:hypothetical protein